MAKPIFIIAVPAKITQEQVQSILKRTEEKIGNEYHVFVTNYNDSEGARFECFNADKVPDIDIEELKAILQLKQEASE